MSWLQKDFFVVNTGEEIFFFASSQNNKEGTCCFLVLDNTAVARLTDSQ